MELRVEHWPIERLRPYDRNPRKNDHAVERQAALLREFGFRAPIIVKADGEVVDGHLRLKAAHHLGWTDPIPVALADDLSDAQVKALRLAMNKSAEWAEWDDDLLRIELSDLTAAGFDLDLGFDLPDLPTGDAAGFGVPESSYREQYGVIVICSDEAEQRGVYERLVSEGMNCRVVAT